ncbi:MAG: CotH kinase family protein [Gemmataceae bacterium]
MTRTFSVLTVILASASLQAQTLDEKANQFFSGKGPVPTLKVEVDKSQIDLLNKDVRKYVRANIHIGQETFRDVGLHLKGAAGSFRNFDDRPAMTINSNKFTKGQTIHGLDKFHLNNSVQDGSYFNELISGDMFLAAGVPTARSCHVIVEINGRKVGLYLLKEGYDKTFLGRHFENRLGNLYDGGFLRDIDQNITLDSGPGCDWKDLKALTKACQEPNLAKRYKEIEKLLDLDKFYPYWVIEVLCCDWDGYTRNRNNYRIYHDPKTDKLVFFAHGKDQMFGNPGDPLVPGWGGLCARGLFETEEGKKRYFKTLKEVFEKHYDVKKMHDRIDALTPRIVEALEKINKDWARGYKEEVKNEKQRIKDRYEFVIKELKNIK